LRVTLISVFILCAALNVCKSQNYKKTNLEILEQDIQSELEKFFYYPDLNRNFQFVFFVTSQKNSISEKKFIESVVKKSAGKNKLSFSIAKDETMYSADSEYNQVKIDVIKLKTEYPKLIKNSFLGEKSIERKIISELDLSIKKNTTGLIVKDKISTSYKDEIAYDDYEQNENDEYRFTQAVPPDISTFETIIFPAAIVTITAVAAILFFTVRSK